MVSLVLCRNRRREKNTNAEEKNKTLFIMKMRRILQTYSHNSPRQEFQFARVQWRCLRVFILYWGHRSPIDEVFLHISLEMSIFPSSAVFLKLCETAAR